MREIDEDEKEIIGKILKAYDELTNKETLVNQENFDLLRDKDENFIDKDIRIQDILYYCICVGVVGKSELEICEELLEACVKTKELLEDKDSKNEDKSKNYRNDRIQAKMSGISEKNKNSEKKIGKNEIDNIKIKVYKRELTKENIEKSSSARLLNYMYSETAIF